MWNAEQNYVDSNVINEIAELSLSRWDGMLNALGIFGCFHAE